jgi:hypothetical protein
MEIIQGINPVSKIVSSNTGKKIGKCGYDYNKMTDSKLLFHEGHKELIKQLRLAGMDIIIVEFVNMKNLYPQYSLTSELPLVNQVKVLDNCIADNLDADYIIYNTDDFKTEFTKEIIDLVDSRLITEDYKNKLNINEHYYSFFRTNMIFLTARNMSNITYVRCYKSGVDTFAMKHYMNKYMTSDLLIVHPIMFDNTFYPLDFTTNINDEIYDNIKIFLNYFHTISKDEIINNPNKVKTDLEKYATDMEHYIEDFTIIDDPVFIGVNKVFISMNFNGGVYNSRFPIYKWL